MSEPLLRVEGLTTGFGTGTGFVPAVVDVGFHLDKGETLCLVGESGSGKSLTAFSIMGLVQPPGRITAGRVMTTLLLADGGVGCGERLVIGAVA